MRENGDLTAAIESYNQAVKINPNYADGYSNLGTALKDTGKIADAISSFEKGLVIDPKN